MQNAKYKIQNAKYKMQNTKCKSFTAWQFPSKDQSWCKSGGKQELQKLKIQNGMLLAASICAKYKFKIGNAKCKMQKKQVSLPDGSQVRARAGAKVEENRNCTTLTFLTNTNQTNIVALYLRGGGYKIILLDNN